MAKRFRGVSGKLFFATSLFISRLCFVREGPRYSRLLTNSVNSYREQYPLFAPCFFENRTQVSVVSQFYNSTETEGFQVHKEAMMLMERMN